MIACDSHEPPAVRELFARWLRGNGVIRPLDSGDYALADLDQHTMGAERKEWRDLIASLRDGRLRRQMPLLAASFTHPVLIAEGGYQRGPEGYLMVGSDLTGWRYNSVMGILRSYRERHGITIVETADLEDTMGWLIRQHHKATKGCFDDE